ncbi:uncharacterized protein G2W53_016763 [Senna tora]|uniref:DUF3527 domain protein n=1 Tax=Senna tora TaxID=362788 RepID=A0A834TWX8_9FABA|nr:uncharacterized protein G2W53_016763 [Senna tora]
MAFNLELKKIKSKEEEGGLKIAKERDPSRKVRHKTDGKIFVQPTRNCSRHSVKGSAIKSDELVKHMTNLPGYLQHNDRVENIQENPLNFGVLDWTRLEKWKHKQKRMPTQGAKPYFQNAKRSQHFEAEEKRKDWDKKNSQVRNFASYLKDDEFSLITDENKYGRDGEAEKSLEDLQQCNLKKKERNHKFPSDIGRPSSKFKSKEIFLGSKKKISSNKAMLTNDLLQESDIDANHKQGHTKPNNIVLLRPREINSRSNKVKINDDQLQDSDVDANYKQCHSKPNDIVLLRPREIPRLRSSEIFELSQRSLDDTLAESRQIDLSNVSSLEDNDSEGLCSEISHSSELSSMVEPAATSERWQYRSDTDQGTENGSVASETPPFSFKRSSLPFEDSKLSNQGDFRNLKDSLDQETAELTAKCGRNSSSSHRFSFSLSRLGRSFSFKEGSTLPQSSSTSVIAKSGPLTSVSSARWDDSSKVKENGHYRTRSSSFRRLLDPILKPKASIGRHLTESSQVQKGSLDSISFRTTSVRESLPDEMSEGSSVQALLQLTMNNGLPIFNFVLNNGTKILASATKSLTSPEKNDSSCYFTFYLLNEIKKKSGGWISHGSKEKNCGYVYNVVGQMKFSSSAVNEPSNQNSKRLSVVKEYVLLGVEIDQRDQGPPKVIQNQEIAAVVVKIPRENLIHKGLHWDNNLKKGCLRCLAEDKCMCSSGEIDISGSTTVILPGGIHSSPIKGEPSSLIDRWKSGGLCDCGGWDVGCRLLVLSNQKQSSKPYNDRFQLFVQEGADQDSPPFSMVPLNDGFYSVEFNSSITHLQAFFISVAVLSCQKLSSSLELTHMHEEIFEGANSLKNNNDLLGKAPVNYTPIPPLSPAGRV